MKKGKKGNHRFLPVSFPAVDHALATLEKQAAWAYQEFKHFLPKKLEKKLNQWNAEEVFRLAIQKRNQIAKEVKHYADSIVSTLNEAHILPNRNQLAKEAKRNLQGFVKKIQKSNVAHIAIDLASAKGSEFLAMLNFPTKKDVGKLNTRLSQLEKKLKNLSQPKPQA